MLAAQDNFLDLKQQKLRMRGIVHKLLDTHIHPCPGWGLLEHRQHPVDTGLCRKIQLHFAIKAAIKPN